MKKILGLDLGSSSIGWALISEPENEEEQYEIIDMGVRIVPLTKDENDEFSKGNAISKNADRTLKRGARRGMHRYKMRKHNLVAVLRALKMMPGNAMFNIPALELYGLRNRAVEEQVTLEELGRILFHLNQKRGYKSNRKANNEEEKSELKGGIQEESESTKKDGKSKKKGYLDLIADREYLIEKEELTIGQYFFRELSKDMNFRVKENIFMRKSYENEFDAIWNVQQRFYPDVLTEEIRNKIRNEIIYYHRPLKSQKGLVSVCEFEGKIYKDKRSDYRKDVFSGPKVIPKSSPLFQVSKIWQELNNVEITSFDAMKARGKSSNIDSILSDFDHMGKRFLSLKEKQDLFEKLNLGEKLNPKQILQFLGYKSGFNEFKINLRNEKFMEGNRTLASIVKILEKHNVKQGNYLRFNLEVETSGRVEKETGEVFTRITSAFEKEPLYHLWHLIYAIDDSDVLVKALVNKYGFSEAVARDFCNLDFHKAGYGNMSARALRNILPHLMQGKGYAESCEMAGYNHSNSITKEENQVRELINRLELYPKNSLRQPVVEKIINQVINLVNDIIDERNGYVTTAERNANDKFEIRVELARDLRQSAEERNNTFKRNSEQDKRHKAIVEKLTPILGKVSKRDIERYKLWEEFGERSPYEPTKIIGLTELFNKKSGVLYDIEHIIPKSRLFDDSFSNKTICPRGMNSGTTGKNQSTAYDYMKSRGDAAFNEYVEFVKSQHYKKDGISKTKFNRLMMSIDKIPDDFINRQMQETRYISKEVRKILEQVCRSVHTSSGSVTAKLRNLWGWDDVLMNLQIEKYRSNGLTEEKEYISNGQTHKVERIVGWSKREDHRHHAIDALTVACTKQGFIQRMNTLNSEHTQNEMLAAKKDRTYEVKLSRLERYLADHQPFDTATVEREAAKILISFKAGKRVASKSKNSIKTKSGDIQQITLTPRGFFHKETVYGQIQQFEKVKLSPRFDRVEDIASDAVKTEVKKHLARFNNDLKEAFGVKELTKFREQFNYDEVTILQKEHVVKYRLNGDFKEKDISSIVDIGVQRIVRKHLAAHGNNSKTAFNAENTVWLNKEKGIAIKSVRCKTGLSDLIPLHTSQNGDPMDYVSTGNNHHMAIYRDQLGNLKENTVSFWSAFERKRIGLPVIVKKPGDVWDTVLNTSLDNQFILEGLPNQNWQFVISLEQNEMFVFGMTREELNNAIAGNHIDLISQRIYRVQKMTKKSSGSITIMFRHHLETSVDDKYWDTGKQVEVKDEMLSKSLGKMIIIQSLQNMTGIKVKVNRLGKLIIV